MDNAEWTEFMVTFDREVVADLMDDFVGVVPELAEKTFAEFCNGIQPFVGTVKERLAIRLGAPTFDEISVERRNTALELLAMRMNEVLPTTCLYLLAMCEERKADGAVIYKFGVILRSEFPEVNAANDPSVIPYIQITGEKRLQTSDTLLSATDALPPDPALGQALAEFMEGHLVPIAERFRRLIARPKRQTIEAFTELTVIASAIGYRKFWAFAAVSPLGAENFTNDMGKFLVAMVLNHALPFDFPFCVALLVSTNGTFHQTIVIERMLNRDIPMAIEEDRVPAVQSGNSYITFLPEERYGVLKDIPPPLLS